MFHYFNGTLAFCALNTAVVECAGVGYRLTISAMTLSRLAGREGTTVRLYAYLAVREDAVELYGFSSEEELEAYKMLIGVSGIGPKAALAILSLFTPEKLAQAIAEGDTRAISRAQGVGGKTAARVVLELKDKCGAFREEAGGEAGADDASASSFADGGAAEAAEVLAVLGYTRAEIASALKKADPTLDSGELVKFALKQLAPGR